MNSMTLDQALAWIRVHQPQARLVGASAVAPQRVHTDTRTLRDGDLFVALRGERFDAHAFLPQARAAGACAAVAEQGLEAAGLAGIEVPDTLRALGSMAQGWRAQWSGPLVAVTGSNGKTTVTQMIASIFRQAAGDAALATQGNLNNAIGVPLTVLRLHAGHRLAVVELGMNHPGEIADLAAIAQPTVALVSNAQREHLEFMGTVDAVARENGQVLCALPDTGMAVFPAQDTYTALWRELAQGRRCITFGVGEAQADVAVREAQWQGDGWRVQLCYRQESVFLKLHMAGRHNLHNAAAAAACALAAGVPMDTVAQGLESFRAVAGRSRLLALSRGQAPLPVVDDTYNANPDSVRAAVDVLAELPAPRLLVLGDMGEVGSQGPAFHEEIGRYAQARGIETIMCLGDLSRHASQAHPHGTHYESLEALQAALQPMLPSLGSVLVKGSRFMKMERVVEGLEHSLMSQQDSRNTGAACC